MKALRTQTKALYRFYCRVQDGIRNKLRKAEERGDDEAQLEAVRQFFENQRRMKAAANGRVGK